MNDYLFLECLSMQLFLFFLFVSLLKRLFNIRTDHIKYVIVQYEFIEIRAYWHIFFSEFSLITSKGFSLLNWKEDTDGNAQFQRPAPLEER